MSGRRAIALTVKVALVGACVAYVAWGVDLSALGARLLEYAPERILATIAISAVAYLFVGVRLVVLFERRVALWPCACAGVLALGVNNLLPARLGELAKVVFLQARGGAGMGRTLGVVFWERFLDMNALLLIGVPVLVALDEPLAVTSLAAVVGGLWLFVASLRLWPSWSEAVVARVPHAGLARVIVELRESLRTGMGPARLGLGGLVTLVVWFCYAAQTGATLVWVAGLPIGPGEVLAVFVAIAIGFAVPAAPGGLGVVEAAVVLSLGWFGIGKEEALAAALLLRATQYVPTTLGALLIIALTDFSLAGLRAGKIPRGADDPAPASTPPGGDGER